MALVVLAFYFLVLDKQTQESRLQQLLLLQHLKRSRRKRLILLQIALRKTRRVRPAWSWPRNQFWFETLLNGNFVEEWWKENFRISRRTFEYILQLVGPDLAKKDTRLRECIPINKRVAVALWRLVYNLHFRVNSLFHYLCSQCYAAQHSYVPLLSLRRDSPSKIVPDFLCATL